MLKPCSIQLLLICLLSGTIQSVHGGGDQSSVIILQFPHGARSLAMGECGVALANDEDVMFYNPAGLGFVNKRWVGGALTSFYEELLPAFNIKDVWHQHNSAIIQFPPGKDTVFLGGLGIDFNMVNYGANKYYDEFGTFLKTVKEREYVFSLSYGTNFEEFGIKNQAFGLSAKYYYSALGPGIGVDNVGVGQGVAIDAGYLWKILPTLRLGVSLLNMGPPVYYITYENADPIPFFINLAIAYDDVVLRFGNLPVLQIAGEIRFEREFVKNNKDKRPDPFFMAVYTSVENQNIAQLSNSIIGHYGIEATLFDCASFRAGFLEDIDGVRFEARYGFGIKILNHFVADWYIIDSHEGAFKGMGGNPDGATGARDHQYGYSVSFITALKWSVSDLGWLALLL